MSFKAVQAAMVTVPDSGIHSSPLSFLITPPFWGLSLYCGALCQTMASLSPPTAFCTVLLCPRSWLVPASGCFCCLASASIETSPDRTCNGLGLAHFGAECFRGVSRVNRLVVIYSDPSLGSHLPVAKEMGSHNTRYEACG